MVKKKEHKKEYQHHYDVNSSDGFFKITSVVGLVLMIVIIIQLNGLSNSLEGATIGSPGALQEDADEGAQPTENNNAPSPSQQPDTAEFDMEVLADDDAFKGDADAPVVIVEWSDYECPFCARFYSQTLSQLEEQYINTGQVKFVYRDFPLNSIHANAQKAAEAAECAGEQGQYFEMHDMLFERGASGGVAAFKQYATDIGLDTDAFNECLDSGEMASEVAEDMQAGSAVGVRGTPGFIINGQLVSGAQPFSVFQQIIEAELA